eukprot:gene10482-3004_t
MLLQYTLGILGPIFGITLFLSPLKTLQNAKTTKIYITPFPYLSMVLNCILWSTYGIFLSNLSIIIPNLFGFCCGAYYIWLCYDLVEEKDLLIRNSFISLLIYIFAVGISLFMNRENPTLILGLICCTASVLLFGSPLIVIRKVINEKNSESIPGPLCFMNTVSSFTWL